MVWNGLGAAATVTAAMLLLAGAGVAEATGFDLVFKLLTGLGTGGIVAGVVLYVLHVQRKDHKEEKAVIRKEAALQRADHREEMNAIRENHREESKVANVLSEVTALRVEMRLALAALVKSAPVDAAAAQTTKVVALDTDTERKTPPGAKR